MAVANGAVSAAEATALLAAVACCATFLIVFYLYATKRFCFTNAATMISGLTCCDNLTGGDSNKHAKLDNREKVQRDLGKVKNDTSLFESYYKN